MILIHVVVRPETYGASARFETIPSRPASHAPTKNYWTDLIAGDGPLAMMEHWSAISESGVMGDPTKATAEKGERLLAAAAAGIVELVDEMRSRRKPIRRDHH